MTSSTSHSPRQTTGQDPDVVIRVYAMTDVGHTREHNEDTFLVADLEKGKPVDFDTEATRELRLGRHGALFLVADGMGGAASGELASSMASHTVLDCLTGNWSHSDISPEVFAAALRDATTLANDRIHNFARENPEHRGMGTTATIAGLLNDHVYVAQVGDSRAYLVRNGKAIQLTKDQSLMQRLVEAGEITPEEAEASDRRNIILQALGPEAQITIDLTHQQLRRGDTLLLCSDGLSGLVRADEIARASTESDDVSVLCHRLVTRANELGGPDNITVIAVRIEGKDVAPCRADDRVGHMVFPMEGTLSDESSMTNTTFKSDPTPPFGFPSPTRDELEAEFRRAETEEMDIGFVQPTVVDRKEKARPVMIALALVAVAVAAWTVWKFVLNR